MTGLFISYAREDLEWCRQLRRYLGALQRGNLIEVFADQNMIEGDWNGIISDNLDAAGIVVMLVSEYFISKEYCALESERAVERWKEKKCKIVRVSLRKCDTTGAAFDFLESVPSPDKPIDGPAWPDKADAFTTVAAAIATLAKESVGVQTGYKLSHRYRDKLDELLHNYCDRSHQRINLVRAFAEERKKLARPFLIVFSGHVTDRPDNFFVRLHKVLLPELLQDNPADLSPMEWPEGQPTEDPFELFRYNLAPSLSVSVYASREEMNESLETKLRISVLPSNVPARLWKSPATAQAMLNAYVRLWEEWPDLPANVLLIPVLTIKYSGDAKLDKRADAALARLNFASRPKLAGVVLPPLPLVEIDDFTDWLLNKIVEPLLGSRIATTEATRLPFPAHMDSVAQKNLPDLLGRL